MAERKFFKLSFTAPPTERRIANRRASGPIQSAPPDSLIAHSVTVNLIFSKIDETNSRAVSGELQGAELIQAVDLISKELESWASHLPERIINTPDNLLYWTKKGFGNIFAVVHMNYYHLCQLLFYQFLHSSTDQISLYSQLTGQYAQNCRQYATQLCDLIHLASETPGAELLNSIVGHVLTIASTVQLHILLFRGDEAEKQNARRLLERNFEFLTRLKVYWPCIDISFSRFEAFHQACSRSQDDSHFRMDQWMLKFMFEFATPLVEKWGDDTDDDDDDDDNEDEGADNFQRPWSQITWAL